MSANSVLVPETAEMAVRIFAALIVGAILGINRDLHRKPAGVRTHSLVSIGSATVIITVLVVSNGNGDSVSRAIQGVIAGIGFLGAGVILHHESERRVEGLTTAASVWVASALGMACGAGFGALAAMALAATLLVLLVGGPLERFLERCFLKDNESAGPD